MMSTFIVLLILLVGPSSPTALGASVPNMDSDNVAGPSVMPMDDFQGRTVIVPFVDGDDPAFNLKKKFEYSVDLDHNAIDFAEKFANIYKKLEVTPINFGGFTNGTINWATVKETVVSIAYPGLLMISIVGVIYILLTMSVQVVKLLIGAKSTIFTPIVDVGTTLQGGILRKLAAIAGAPINIMTKFKGGKGDDDETPAEGRALDITAADILIFADQVYRAFEKYSLMNEDDQME